MSFTLFLDTTNATQNTAGKDYTWNFDFSAVEQGAYDVSFAFSSRFFTVGAATPYNGEPTPVLNMSIQQAANAYELDTVSNQHTSSHIGLLKYRSMQQDNTTAGTLIAQLDAEWTTNPPITFRNVGTSSNTVRLWITQAGAGNPAIGVSVVGFMVSLRFEKKESSDIL